MSVDQSSSQSSLCVIWDFLLSKHVASVLKRVLGNEMGQGLWTTVRPAVWLKDTYLDLSTGSTPTVGSSRMSSSGFCSKAAPRDTLLRCPPLKTRSRISQRKSGWRNPRRYSRLFCNLICACHSIQRVVERWEPKVAKTKCSRQTCPTGQKQTIAEVRILWGDMV